MNTIPCSLDRETRRRIEVLAEQLKTRAHEIPDLGLGEEELYDRGLFRGAIERVRGQYSAQMHDKRQFVTNILNHMQDRMAILEWSSAGGSNRFDYSVVLPGNTLAIIELKGCLDGNNTTIFERPEHADEFYIWSYCNNAGANPRHNAWSGIHTRLSAEIIDKRKQVDGLVIWDALCGTIGRPCPKLNADPQRFTEIGSSRLPPPCIYLFPRSVPTPRNNPRPKPHSVSSLKFIPALAKEFGTKAEELYSVAFEVRYEGSDISRKTSVSLNGELDRESRWTPIRRS